MIPETGTVDDFRKALQTELPTWRCVSCDRQYVLGEPSEDDPQIFWNEVGVCKACAALFRRQINAVFREMHTDARRTRRG